MFSTTSLFPFLSLLFLAFAHASPQLPLVSAHDTFLIPRHTLFLRQSTNLQTFTEAVGGAAASPITNSGDPKRPFQVDGDTFPDFKSASERTCDNQNNACSEAANTQGNKGSITVSDCGKQKERCTAAQEKTKVQNFTTGTVSTNIGPDPAFPDFDLICDA
ncbi:hypothetical protein K504DRAFT_476569 [Pleomassaria siparia CBS 279.74]|uniref:Uncharacterized protein n=1 Tax=Pleomassaria siparia CBS 279.74 TaxID=1314801 RepID=A0A6G1K8R9_9PLEO|nr:hypothetical protein K504DRAFT_476569 [Pleomassaria siparia CBS 279.74]